MNIRGRHYNFQILIPLQATQAKLITVKKYFVELSYTRIFYSSLTTRERWHCCANILSRNGADKLHHTKRLSNIGQFQKISLLQSCFNMYFLLKLIKIKNFFLFQVVQKTNHPKKMLNKFSQHIFWLQLEKKLFLYSAPKLLRHYYIDY